MEKCREILRKIFFLPSFATVVIAVPSFASVIYVLSEALDGWKAYFSYAASAYALVISATGLCRLGGFVRSVREHMDDHPAVRRIQKLPFGERFLQDVRFRTEVSLYQGFFINLLYIIMKMASGLYYRSPWFVALAIYYALLASMRFLLLRRGRRKADRKPEEEELRRYRFCGIMLLMMNQALMGIVVFIVHRNQGYEYPGMLIYAMAAYAFYAVITASINLVKFRKHGSPVMSAAKVVNLVAAMVSILSLTTAMISQFGSEEAPEFRRIMTGAVGGGVCMIVLGMAVFMIANSTRQIKSLRFHNLETENSISEIIRKQSQAEEMERSI